MNNTTTLSNSLTDSMTPTDWLVASLALGTLMASCLLAFLFQAYTRHSLATLPYNIVLHLNGYLVQVVLASVTILRKENINIERGPRFLAVFLLGLIRVTERRKHKKEAKMVP
jgi:hypothetical protein